MPNPASPQSSLTAGLRVYVERQANTVTQYVLEQAVFFLTGWIPSVIGIGLRAIVYRLIVQMQGVAAIEHGVDVRDLPDLLRALPPRPGIA